MAGKQAEGATHADLWSVLPEALTIVYSKTSPFYDERVKKPVPEWLIDSIIRHEGVIEPVVVMRDGDDFVVDDGRQRTRALLEVNQRRAKAGKPPLRITYFIKRPLNGDAGIIGLSAAANLHVEDSPMMRARKAARMLAAEASMQDVAADFGVTVPCVDNWIKLLDCSTEVQKAVDAGQVAETVARDLSALDRDKQRAALDAMIAQGSHRGAAAKRAVAAVKRGKPVPERGAARKMRSRVKVQALLDGLLAREHSTPATLAHDVPLLRWILGEPGSESDLPDDARAVSLPPKGA